MALPGANVTLANPATGFSRTVQSDTSGAFAFPSVPPGTYALTVEMQGFKTSVVDKVALQVDSTSELSIDLADRQPVGVGPGRRPMRPSSTPATPASAT